MVHYLRILLSAILILSINIAVAFDSFKISHIQFAGLQKISTQTAKDAIPVHEGDLYQADTAAKIIQSLYQTGFFKDISLFRKQNTLVIRVQERPTISHIKINGNKIATEEELKKSLKVIGLAEGEFYDPAIVDGIIRSLKRQYLSRGNHQVMIEPVVTEIDRNRVQVVIEINEGKLARIDEIHISGNVAFPEEKLLQQLPVSRSTLMTVFNHKDVYSDETLSNVVEALHDFYLDNGYVQFKVIDQKAIYSTDKKYLRIELVISEGPRYRLADWALVGKIDDYRAQLEALITLKPKQWFSRKEVLANSAKLNHFYGQRGYAMVKIDPATEFDHSHHLVHQHYIIEPGKLISVRNINFIGNNHTQSTVLRREQRQMEGAQFNSDLVQASVRRLRLLGYIKNAELKVSPVADIDDQVDLDYLINEAIKTGSLNAGIGFGSDNGLFGQAGFQQPNFLGTGKTFGMNFSVNKAQTAVSFSYDNPYFTDDGISSSISAYAQHIDADKINITDYSSSLYGFNYGLGIPMSEDDKVRISLGYERVELDTGNHPSPHIQYFTDKHGKHFNEILLSLSWSHNGYDRALFPTSGYYHNASLLASLPTFEDELTYYKAYYYGHYYYPLWHNFILSLRGELGYGDGYGDFDQLPFLKNYYTGGTNSIRGFNYNSLGPRATSPYTGLIDDSRTLGGNLLMMGSVALVLPPMHSDLRTSLFFDFGNVFDTHAKDYKSCNHPNGQTALHTLCKGSECLALTDCHDIDGSVNFSEIRSSMGVSFEWLTPMGPMLISLSTPVKKLDGDATKGFQFSVGTIL